MFLFEYKKEIERENENEKSEHGFSFLVKCVLLMGAKVRMRRGSKFRPTLEIVACVLCAVCVELNWLLISAHIEFRNSCEFNQSATDKGTFLSNRLY